MTETMDAEAQARETGHATLPNGLATRPWWWSRVVSLADLRVPIGYPGFDSYPNRQGFALHWECGFCLAINILESRSRCIHTTCSRLRTPGARVTDAHSRSVGHDHAMVRVLWDPTTLPYGVYDVDFRRP